MSLGVYYVIFPNTQIQSQKHTNARWKNTKSIMYFCEIKKMNFSTLKPLGKTTQTKKKQEGKTSFSNTNTFFSTHITRERKFYVRWVEKEKFKERQKMLYVEEKAEEENNTELSLSLSQKIRKNFHFSLHTATHTQINKYTHLYTDTFLIDNGVSVQQESSFSFSCVFPFTFLFWPSINAYTYTHTNMKHIHNTYSSHIFWLENIFSVVLDKKERSFGCCCCYRLPIFPVRLCCFFIAVHIALCDRGRKRRQAALYKWYRNKKTHTK